MLRNRFRLFHCAVVLAAAFTSPLALAQATIKFNLPEQELADALRVVGRQTSTNIIFEPGIVKGLKFAGIRAELTSDQAIDALLKGTMLIAQRISTDTVVIQRANQGASVAVSESNEGVTGERATNASEFYAPLLRLTQAGSFAASVKTTGDEEPSETQQMQDEPGLRLEEVVVTARKTQERLQDVPISVTAFSGKQLEELGAVDVKDVLRMVPGLAYEGTERGLSRYNIRGVSTVQALPTVGIYLDDISLVTVNNEATGIQGAFDPVFFDFERLEVLKGPQGTLYGGSAMGGAIKYVSARPNLSERSFSVAAGGATIAHGSQSYNAEAVVNLPIVSDVLAVRGGFAYRHEGGYIDNVANADVQNSLVSSTPFPAYTPLTQPSQSTLNKDDYNDGDTYVGRLSLLWQPDPSFTIRPAIFYQESTFANPGQFFINLPELTTSYRLPQDTVDRATIASVEVVKDWGGVELTSLTAYFDRKALFERDFSLLIGGLVAPFFDFNSLAYYPTHTEQFSQEFRIASDRTDSSRFDWTLGLFYSTLDHAFGGTAFTYGVGFPDDAFFTTDTQVELDQSAVFGDATFRITDNLDISVGVRVFRYERSNVETTAFPGQDFDPTTANFATEEDGVSPRVAIEYRLSEDHLLYASAAKGFRPGGAQNNDFAEQFCTPEHFALIGYDSAPESFGSDSLWTYEFGSKNEFAQGRVLLNGSVYYSDWSDIQQSIAVPNCNGGFIANAGSARLQGADIEARVNLTPDFQIGGNAGYVDAQISETAAGGLFREGDTIQGVPEWTASAYVLYRRPISGDWGFQFRADYQYRSEARRSYTHTIGVQFPPYAPGDTHALPNPTEFQEGYAVASGYVALDNGATSFRLYVNNAFDERPFLDTDLGVGSDRSTTIRPRTVGFEIRQEF